MSEVPVMKPWKRDLFGSGWFGDYYYSCNCCACAGAEIAESLDKSACSWFFLYYCCCCFLPCLIFSQRGSMRQKYGLHGKHDDQLDYQNLITGDACNDCLLAFCCGYCAMGQMRYEGIYRRIEKEVKFGEVARVTQVYPTVL